jgi:hypothetical protein
VIARKDEVNLCKLLIQRGGESGIRTLDDRVPSMSCGIAIAGAAAIARNAVAHCPALPGARRQSALILWRSARRGKPRLAPSSALAHESYTFVRLHTEWLRIPASQATYP